MELESYLIGNGIWHRFVEKPETVHTADAAKEAGIDLHKVTKSLVMLDQDKNTVLAIIPGDCKLSFPKARKVLGTEKLRLVPFEDAEKYSGYLPGATPMVCHKKEMKVVMDKKLSSLDTIYGGGGSRTRLLEMRTEDVVRLNRAVVADITE